MDSTQTPPRSGWSKDVTIAGLARILRTWRRPFLLMAVGLPFLTLVLMVFTKNQYTSTGTILVETPEGGMGADLLSQVRSITGLTPQAPPTEMYLAILKSDRVQMAVADSLGLADYYKIEAPSEGERMEKTLLKMGSTIKFRSDELISIAIAATDRSPQMAADIVNAFLNQLEVASQSMALSRARRTRRLVEDDLRSTNTELDSSRAKMRDFQETYGVFAIEKQTEGTLDLIGNLQTQLLAAQTKRDQLEGFTSEKSLQIRNLDLEIQALTTQIKQLVIGDLKKVVVRKNAEGGEATQLAGRPNDSFFIPLTELPQLANEYAKLKMNLGVQEAKFQVLATELEQTKIEESQSVPTFEILDWGRRPYKKSGPHRGVTVLAAMVGGLLGGVLLVVMLDDLSNRVDPETRSELAGVLPGFLKRRSRG